MKQSIFALAAMALMSGCTVVPARVVVAPPTVYSAPAPIVVVPAPPVYVPPCRVYWFHGRSYCR